MFLSREEVREIDRRAIEEFGMPGIVLMENAGRGAAELLVRLGIHGRVMICCGKGNNGGDGFVIARHLDNHGVSVQVVLFAKPEDLTGDAAINYQTISRSGLPIEVFSGTSDVLKASAPCFATAEWIVDALFGTGLAGPLRAPMNQVVQAINDSRARVLAVDIPSGLDCNTGQPLGATVQAEHTATFVALKKGFANPAAKKWLGQVHAIDIGIPRRLLTPNGSEPKA